MSDSKIINTLEKILFSNRPWVIGFFVLVTIFMFFSATKLKVDAGFSKLLPLQHEYMQTFTKHREEFGGANRILVALIAKDGDMFTSEFFDALKQTTDDVFFIEGIDRTRVTSIFTPNVRFTEVVEDGIAGGNVVPDDYENTAAGRARVKENVIKAGIVGRLVANDFSGALISAQLLEFHPNTGERLDYVDVARQLEENIRQKHNGAAVGVDINYHIIGFAKVIGDITEGAKRVVVFFIIALFIKAQLLYIN
ncbi:MAG: putative RND superfamily exporter protein, partial [Marinomonas primoryensis]